MKTKPFLLLSLAFIILGVGVTAFGQESSNTSDVSVNGMDDVYATDSAPAIEVETQQPPWPWSRSSGYYSPLGLKRVAIIPRPWNGQPGEGCYGN